MKLDLPFFPPSASSYSGWVDLVTLSLLLLCGFISSVVFGLILIFSIRYRSGSGHSRVIQARKQSLLEWSWTFATFGIFVVIFCYSAVLYFHMHAPPPDSSEISVVAKQWMWKFQHADGRSELNELHVPVGQPIVLAMISQDVIHSFFVPAFRLKQDVLPDRYTRAWFKATVPGEYDLFCTQYCGTDHAGMRGKVTVLSARDYQLWLQSGIAHSSVQNRGSRIEMGHRLFDRFGCVHCHDPGSAVRAPDLHGIFGKQVALTNGSSVEIDENYLRESIVNPSVKIVAGYADIMPPFNAQASQEDLLNLIAYIKSLSAPGIGSSTP